MKGYKGFNADMTCRGMQYEIGKTYSMDEYPVLCERGFHFCQALVNCFGYYDPENGAVICEVDAGGTIAVGENKAVANNITIVRQADPIEVWRAFYGNGSGDGHGYGYSYGYGNGYGDGNGDGNGYGDGCGHGNGDDDGRGNGNGCGHGDGPDYGNGNGNGRGNGYADRNIQKALTFKEG